MKSLSKSIVNLASSILAQFIDSDDSEDEESSMSDNEGDGIQT